MKLTGIARLLLWQGGISWLIRRIIVRRGILSPSGLVVNHALSTSAKQAPCSAITGGMLRPECPLPLCHVIRRTGVMLSYLQLQEILRGLLELD